MYEITGTKNKRIIDFHLQTSCYSGFECESLLDLPVFNLPILLQLHWDQTISEGAFII